MIQELKQLIEALEATTQVTVDSATVSRAGSVDATAEPLPPYTETVIEDGAVDGLSGWVGDDCIQSVEERHVLAELDEILLLLIAVRGTAIGKELGDDINRVFGTDVSAGTVYPRLAALAEAGQLEVRELPRRKVYSLADTAAVADELASEIDELIVFSAVLRALLSACTDADRDHLLNADREDRHTTHE